MNNSSGIIPVLILVALLILSAGCTAANRTDIIKPVATSSTGQSHTGTAVDPNNETQLREFIADFDTYAGNAREAWKVPGMAVAIVKDGKIVFAKGYGTKTAGGSDPVTADTVFQIGSTSKAFTAALTAMEVDRGGMNWSDPVKTYVPDFQMKDPWVTKEYTITDSLAQNSGLEGYWGTELPFAGFSRNDMIHALRYAEPVSSFRSEFKYQNLAFLVTAAAVEKTSQKSWEDNLQTRIFTPLHMTSASSSYAAFRAAPDHTSLHTTGVLADKMVGPIPTNPDWEFNDFAYVMGPAGGINANVKDMATWTIFNMGNGSFEGKQLISPENMALLHTPKTPVAKAMTDTKRYYCQGWMYQEEAGSPSFVWHNGATAGNHAMILFVPGKDIGIVILANDPDASMPDVLALTFYNRYSGRENPDLSGQSLDAYEKSKEVFLVQKPVRPANAPQPLALTEYTGSYVNDVYGKATVTEVNGNLSVTFGKRPVIYNLSPWDANNFTAKCPQWGPAFDGGVSFGTGSDGKVRALTLTPLFTEGKTATFNRVSA